jgi:hypothetical protein
MKHTIFGVKVNVTWGRHGGHFVRATGCLVELVLCSLFELNDPYIKFTSTRLERDYWGDRHGR